MTSKKIFSCWPNEHVFISLSTPHLTYDAKTCYWNCQADYASVNTLYPIHMRLLGRGITRELAWLDAMYCVDDMHLLRMGLPSKAQVMERIS